MHNLALIPDPHPLRHTVYTYITNPIPQSAFNPFTAKFKNVVWDHCHVQFYTSFKEAKHRINQNYLLAYENRLNIMENSAVQAQTPPFKGGVSAGSALFLWRL